MNAMTVETQARETRKDRLALARWAGMGRMSGLGVIAGVLVAYAAFAVLVGVTTALVQALGIDVDLTDREWRQVGTGAAIAAGVLLFVAYLFGGYVSGRMARRAGLTNGLLVFVAALVVAAITVGVVQFTGVSGEALERVRESLRNFGVPTSGRQWDDVGTVAGIAALVGMFVGSLLGGVLGERWHVKLAHNALDTVHAVGPLGTDRGGVADRPGRKPGNDPVDVLGTRVEELHGRIDALQESAPGPTAVVEHRVLSTATAGDTDTAIGGEADSDRLTAESEHFEDLTKAELYQQAREAEVQGRSDMSKLELIKALSENDNKPVEG